jgi:DNA-binding NtrC family response regulator
MLRRILLVEDEALIRTAIAELLRNDGYHVGEATDGGQALQLLAEEKFDLVICDFVLPAPAIDGFHLIDKIQYHYPNTRILIVSGYLPAGALKVAVRERIEFLSKPFECEVLLSLVRRLLEP